MIDEDILNEEELIMQNTFNTDSMYELVEEGSVENYECEGE